jgi:hypothetical protein
MAIEADIFGHAFASTTYQKVRTKLSILRKSLRAAHAPKRLIVAGVLAPCSEALSARIVFPGQTVGRCLFQGRSINLLDVSGTGVCRFFLRPYELGREADKIRGPVSTNEALTGEEAETRRTLVGLSTAATLIAASLLCSGPTGPERRSPGRLWAKRGNPSIRLKKPPAGGWGGAAGIVSVRILLRRLPLVLWVWARQWLLRRRLGSLLGAGRGGPSFGAGAATIDKTARGGRCGLARNAARPSRLERARTLSRSQGKSAQTLSTIHFGAIHVFPGGLRGRRRDVDSFAGRHERRHVRRTAVVCFARDLTDFRETSCLMTTPSQQSTPICVRSTELPPHHVWQVTLAKVCPKIFPRIAISRRQSRQSRL